MTHARGCCVRSVYPPRAAHGLPGTNPVFLVDDKYAVKLFTDLFGDPSSSEQEIGFYELLASQPEIPAPELLAHGALFDNRNGWRWPWIITTILPGRSLTEDRSRLSADDLDRAATFAAEVLRRIHSLPTHGSTRLASTWSNFDRFLAGTRAKCVAEHVRHGSIPDHLLSLIDDYVLDRSSPPRLLHCDLNADHVFGEFRNGRWAPTGILDFADAKVGDPLYDWIALHHGLFNFDKRLLRRFMAEYGARLPAEFPHRSMSFALLHECDVFDELFTGDAAACEATTWKELARMIWDIDSPGITALPTG